MCRETVYARAGVIVALASALLAGCSNSSDSDTAGAVRLPGPGPAPLPPEVVIDLNTPQGRMIVNMMQGIGAVGIAFAVVALIAAVAS